MTLPRSPADPRPEGRPAFIAPDCTTCGTPLRVADLHNGTPPNEAWNDEFECPKCLDGVILDAPTASAFVTAWDTDLGRWRLAWVEYLRGGANSPGFSDGSVETADEAFAREIALAHEVCDDERDADAAVGVMPAPLVVYGPPGGDA